MSPHASSLFTLIAPLMLACTASRPDLGGRADTVEAGAAPTRVATAQGFENPEAARHDADLDLFFVASMNGDGPPGTGTGTSPGSAPTGPPTASGSSPAAPTGSPSTRPRAW